MKNDRSASRCEDSSRSIISLLVATMLFGFTTVQGQEIEITVANQKRTATIYNAPKSKDPLRPYVIVLHGGAGSARSMRAGTGFDSLARSEGFAVAYAQGTEWASGRFAWNTGYLLRGRIGMSDDIAYLDRLIDKVISEHGADPTRIYMTGGSNGAMMTFVYAVARAERLAAVATVVGAMFSFDKQPKVPLPILMINGEKDNEVPIGGGFSGNPLVRRGQSAPYKSLAQTIEFWRRANRSASSAKTIRIKDAFMTVYDGPANGAPTVSVIDKLGGHGWPGTRGGREENIPIQSFEGARLVWDFFQDKNRRLP